MWISRLERLNFYLIILYLGKSVKCFVSQFPHPSTVYVCVSVCVCVHLYNKSNPDSGSIKLIKYGPYMQGFKRGKTVVMVILQVIVMIKRGTICEISSAVPDTLTIYI